MTSSYLFDSHALLAFFQNETGAETVAGILRKAMKLGDEKFICLINLGEILYMTKRRFGDTKKMQVLARVHQLGITILPIPDSLVYQAAEIKAQYPISYADCFALACARNHSAALVTGDPDFKTVSHLASIIWTKGGEQSGS
jgi:predicted nucleic acid-binding protein